MNDRATCWSVVINNPVESDRENMAAARQKGWKVEGGLEEGELEKTPHYQLCVSTPQVRFSAVKKAFPRANIQVARNKAALLQYCNKEETRIGDLPETESKFPTLAGFYKLLIPKLFCLNKSLRVDVGGGWYSAASGDPEQRLLDALDAGTSELIREGYHVETIVVNPQTRSAFKRFGMDIIERTIQELSKMSVDRQTDRQTGLLSRPTVITKDAESSRHNDSSPELLPQQGEGCSYGSSTTESEEAEEDSDCGDCTETSDSQSDSQSS